MSHRVAIKPATSNFLSCVIVPSPNPVLLHLVKQQSTQLISKAAPFTLILFPSTLPSPPRSLVLIRHVHIRGRGDAFMIIHPPYPPLIMAALDAHLRHLALALFSPIVCITTLFNGLFSLSWGGWRKRRAGNFPRVSSRWGPSKEPLGRSSVIVIDGTMFKWRAEGDGSGGPLPITEYPLCLATPFSCLSDG